jgi:hypothetical protein
LARAGEELLDLVKVSVAVPEKIRLSSPGSSTNLALAMCSVR